MNSSFLMTFLILISFLVNIVLSAKIVDTNKYTLSEDLKISTKLLSLLFVSK